jgi:hypothetical protein
MTRLWGSLILLALATALASCSNIDQFSARVYNTNVNSQTALDEETLLNIERASTFQPLTFVAITKTTGSRSGDLKIGLPTATLGPGQTLLQKQSVFAGNTLDNAMQGTFETNPLITTAFQQGMLTAISPKTVAMLLSEYPRELVFYAVLDGIEMVGGKHAWYFKNDPTSDAYDGIDFNPKCRALETVTRHGVEHTRVSTGLNVNYDRDCNFSQFAYLLEYGLSVGLKADVVQAVAPKPAAAKGSSSKKDDATSSSPGSEGVICFDPASSWPDMRADAFGMENQCDAPTRSKTIAKFPFGDTLYDIRLRFRSPMGVYMFLGKLIRDHAEANVESFHDPDLRVMNSRKLINIVPGFSDCLMVGALLNESFCVPKDQSEATLVMIGILEQLRNLNINSTELNASFSVHVAD